MTDQEIINRIKKIVTPYAQEPEGLQDFNEQTDFINDLKINSANLVDVILDVEDEFDIIVDNEAMEGMLTVGDARAIVRKKRDEQ